VGCEFANEIKVGKGVLFSLVSKLLVTHQNNVLTDTQMFQLQLLVLPVKDGS